MFSVTYVIFCGFLQEITHTYRKHEYHNIYLFRSKALSHKVLFITSQPELFQLSLIFLNNGQEEYDISQAVSLSSSIDLLESEEKFKLIFVGHKIEMDKDLKDLSQALLPHVNSGATITCGSNRAFKGKEWATYYNELTPLPKVLIDLYELIGQSSQSAEQGYLPFPLLSLLEFKEYPFDCFVRIKKASGPAYIQIFRENDEVELDDVYKYKDKGAKNVFASVEKINEKMKILETALRSEAAQEYVNDPEKVFQLSTEYTLDVLKETGLQLPDGLVEKNKEAFDATKEIVNDYKTKSELKSLLKGQDNLYYKHVSMTSLIACFILEEVNLDDSANRQKLCSAAYMQNIYLQNEDELLVFEEAQLERFNEEDKERIIKHPQLAVDLLSKNPLVDVDVMKLIKEQHGDKRGMTFPEVFASSSKMSLIFQVSSLFSLLFLISYERSEDGEVDTLKIFEKVSERLNTKDQSLIKGIRQVVTTVDVSDLE